jgi:hypothetical protein
MAPSKLKGKAANSTILPHRPSTQTISTPQSVAQAMHQNAQHITSQVKPDATPQHAPVQMPPVFSKPPPIDFTALITSLANHNPPSSVTIAFRALLSTFPNAIFSPYEIKVICAMIEPSILLPTSPYYDHSIDGVANNPANVSQRLLSFEFAPQGSVFVQEAVKAQADKTSAAWQEHNEKLRLILNDVWILVKEREDGLTRLMEKHGIRHPVTQALKDAVVQEHVWLQACIQDNRDGFAKHLAHLEKVKEGNGQK